MALGNGNLDGPGTDADGLGHGAGAQGADQDGTEGGPSADYGGQGEFDGLGYGNSTDTDAIGTDANPTESPNYDAYDNPEDDNTTRAQQEREIDRAYHRDRARPTRTSLDQDMPSTSPQSPHNRNLTESHVQSAVNSIRAIKNPREREKAIKNFMERNKKGLRQLSVRNAQDTDLGLFGMMPGVGMLNMSRNLIMGLFEKMGLTPGINSPAMDALEQEARSLGLLDKEATEPTEDQLMQVCNNTPGYKWNSETKTCEKIEFGGV